MDIGKCNGYYQSWYYDKSDGYCKQFVYGGCEGNLNRFETELSCRQRCNAKPPVGKYFQTISYLSISNWTKNFCILNLDYHLKLI